MSVSTCCKRWLCFCCTCTSLRGLLLGRFRGIIVIPALVDVLHANELTQLDDIGSIWYRVFSWVMAGHILCIVTKVTAFFHYFYIFWSECGHRYAFHFELQFSTTFTSHNIDNKKIYITYCIPEHFVHTNVW